MAEGLTRRFFVQGTAAGAAMSALSTGAFAQNYPSKPITIIAPATPGGPSDTVARAAALRLQARFGQNVIVENKAGASGNIGAQAAARSEPDGYTLAVLLGPLAQNVNIFKNPGFDLVHDFEPLAHMASVDLLIVGRAGLPVNNLDELLDYTKANPGKLSCGSQSPPQMEYLKRTTKLDFTTVPYRGSSLIANDVVAGQVDMGLVPLSDAAQHLQAGTMKALFTCGPKRAARLPDVAAVGERFPGFYFWSWYGIAAPARTPAPTLAKLRAELRDIALAPDFTTFLSEIGLTPVEDPGGFAKVIANEIAQWRRIVEELDLPRI
jgi:tripartite-type tricarboxylate transporter receptor subunit TctC